MAEPGGSGRCKWRLRTVREPGEEHRGAFERGCGRGGKAAGVCSSFASVKRRHSGTPCVVAIPRVRLWPNRFCLLFRDHFPSPTPLWSASAVCLAPWAAGDLEIGRVQPPEVLSSRLLVSEVELVDTPACWAVKRQGPCTSSDLFPHC